MSAKDFIFGAKLGEGSFGDVSLCTQISTGKLFAIKKIVLALVRKQHHGPRRVLTEKQALRKLRAAFEDLGSTADRIRQFNVAHVGTQPGTF